MKRTNTTLDREPMNSEAIRQRQDFNYILKEARAAKVPIWKSIWFYGPVGIAMVTMVVSAVRTNPQNELNDNNTTLAQTEVTGWTASTELGELSTTTSSDALEQEKEYSMEDSFEGHIPKKNGTSPDDKKTTEETIIAATSTEKADDNTKLKPEVLAEEKIDIAPRKSVRKTIKKPSNGTSQLIPQIAGVFNGRVPIGQICSSGVITCNNGYKIISFDIQYDNGVGSTVDRVSGEEIPPYILRNLRKYNVGSPVFITKIIAMNEKGERKQLLSMNIEPTF